ncbi:hypothetical protein P5673_014282 [Acropora cervicornis]|uniref:Uncharacterized protein n=1 Tax=Acropora cervicornis TaxID=6130 RepID=A0AAD9QJU6_ACRCE|nr:hypothetical protein P5673_014282 [Acropora cervicornis]
MTWNALLFASREPNVFYTAEYEIQMEEPAVEIKDYDERDELLGDHALLYLLFLALRHTRGDVSDDIANDAMELAGNLNGRRELILAGVANDNTWCFLTVQIILKLPILYILSWRKIKAVFETTAFIFEATVVNKAALSVVKLISRPVRYDFWSSFEVVSCGTPSMFFGIGTLTRLKELKECLTRSVYPMQLQRKVVVEARKRHEESTSTDEQTLKGGAPVTSKFLSEMRQEYIGRGYFWSKTPNV